MVLTYEAVLDLDMIRLLASSNVVCLNGFGRLTNQSKYPLHFSVLTQKIFLEIVLFCF